MLLLNLVSGTPASSSHIRRHLQVATVQHSSPTASCLTHVQSGVSRCLMPHTNRLLSQTYGCHGQSSDKSNRLSYCPSCFFLYAHTPMQLQASFSTLLTEFTKRSLSPCTLDGSIPYLQAVRLTIAFRTLFVTPLHDMAYQSKVPQCRRPRTPSALVLRRIEIS